MVPPEAEPVAVPLLPPKQDTLVEELIEAVGEPMLVTVAVAVVVQLCESVMVTV